MASRGSGFACMECGKKFKTIAAAERASTNGCPKCGGVDVDLASPEDYDGWNDRQQLAHEESMTAQEAEREEAVR